jgi:hypothetical protein
MQMRSRPPGVVAALAVSGYDAMGPNSAGNTAVRSANSETRAPANPGDLRTGTEAAEQALPADRTAGESGQAARLVQLCVLANDHEARHQGRHAVPVTRHLPRQDVARPVSVTDARTDQHCGQCGPRSGKR